MAIIIPSLCNIDSSESTRSISLLNHNNIRISIHIGFIDMKYVNNLFYRKIHVLIQILNMHLISIGNIFYDFTLIYYFILLVH